MKKEDKDCMVALYSESRREEINRAGMDKNQAVIFLSMQFEAQQKYYFDTYPKADYMVVEQGGKTIGRLYLYRAKQELRIIDILLFESCRGTGIGSKLMYDILDEAKRDAKYVTIHVAMESPAIRLYKRLGFKNKGDAGLYHFMEFTPASLKGAEAC